MINLGEKQTNSCDGKIRGRDREHSLNKVKGWTAEMDKKLKAGLRRKKSKMAAHIDSALGLSSLSVFCFTFLYVLLCVWIRAATV